VGDLQGLPRLFLVRPQYFVECLRRSERFSYQQGDENGDCTDRTLALQAEYLPFELFRWEVREYEPDESCNIRSSGKTDRGIATSKNSSLFVRKIESEPPLADRNTRQRLKSTNESKVRLTG